MRYSLRNQNKIIDAFEKDDLFIKPDVSGGTKYNLLFASEREAMQTMFFYIVGKTYDVYNLAYKEKIS